MKKFNRSAHRWARPATALAMMSISGLLPAQLPHPFDVSKIDGLNGFRLINVYKPSIAGVGDIDGDGFDDMLMGEYQFGLQCPFFSCKARGAVYWLRGSAERNSIQLDMSNLALPDGVAHAGAFDNAQAGKLVTGVGDFNGDMLNDILFTARSQVSGSNFNGYVVFGRTSGFPNGITSDLADGINGFRIEGTNVKSASAAGDVNGDGYDDIVIGNDDAYNDYGAAWIIFGRNQGSIKEVLNVEHHVDDRITVVNGSNRFTSFAYNNYSPALTSAGDIDGDGFDDLLISEYLANPSGIARAGSVNAILGKNASIETSLSTSDLNGVNGFRINGSYENEFLGTGLSTIGDLNGDGYCDVTLGSMTYNPSGISYLGANFVLFGSRDVLPADIDISTTHDLRIDGTLSHPTGVSLSNPADIDGDGYMDIAVTAAGYNSITHGRSGVAFIIYGDEVIENPYDFNQSNGKNGVVFNSSASELIYNTYSVGDINGDGLHDCLLEIVHSVSRFRDYRIIFGSGTSQQATYKSFARSDDAPISGIGYANKGAQSAPSSRLWVDFELGSGFGKDNASLQVVTRTLRGSDLSNLHNPANVYWFLETDRENYIREGHGGVIVGYVEIMVKYLDGEVWHLDENSLALYSAPSPDGPWTLMDNQVLNTAQNRIKARTTSLLPLYFAIAGNPVEQASIPTPSLLTLTPYTDAWLAPLGPAERFFPPAQIGFTGFRHALTGWQTMSGDFNGDGVADLATITPWGQWWTALGGTHLGFNPPEKQGVSWHSEPQGGYLVLAGDYDGDAADTLLQLGPNGNLSSVQPPQLGQNPDGPQFLASTSLRHNPTHGLYVFVADIDGDGADDLAQIDNVAGDISWARSTGTKFAPLAIWGSPGFVHDPADGKGIHFGDFNGDGELDVCEIAFPQARVALGNGATLAAPTVWSPNLYFQDNPNEADGWYVFATDIDRDGTDDLIQLTDTGEVWTSRSNGADAFSAPTRNAQLGFHHKPDGPWQVFVVR